jgi:hypothetical protein
MSETTDFMQKWEEEAKERKQKAKETLLSFSDAIKAAGYTYLVCCFDGSGDSGQVETCFLSNDENAECVRYEGEMTGEEDLGLIQNPATQIQDAAWDLTPDGFENNEGGFGAVIVDAELKTVKVNYSYRVEDSVSDDYEV